MNDEPTLIGGQLAWSMTEPAEPAPPISERHSWRATLRRAAGTVSMATSIAGALLAFGPGHESSAASVPPKPAITADTPAASRDAAPPVMPPMSDAVINTISRDGEFLHTLAGHGFSIVNRADVLQGAQSTCHNLAHGSKAELVPWMMANSPHDPRFTESEMALLVEIQARSYCPELNR